MNIYLTHFKLLHFEKCELYFLYKSTVSGKYIEHVKLNQGSTNTQKLLIFKAKKTLHLQAQESEKPCYSYEKFRGSKNGRSS